mgnify:FL=1
MLAIIFIIPAESLAIERSEQIAIFKKRLKEIIQKGVLPIIDVEYHHGGKIETERLISRMDDNGVALT